ncbi:MAG: glucose-6-phosphate isomerase [Alphaproteobacteria bacterium]|nr:glucose-6-phosphate isomerase [Alphaproteobacteria bacterium]
MTAHASSPALAAAWARLAREGQRLAGTRIEQLFATDPNRTAVYSRAGLLTCFDFSRTLIDRKAMDALLALAEAAGVADARDAMFAGAPINRTEGRSVLHVALRAAKGSAYAANGRPVSAEVDAVRAQMDAFAEKVRSGAWTGHTGKRIRAVVNIGIGGSDLGPRLVADALRPYLSPELALHFVSNVDGEDMARVLGRVSPEETLFIVASKTFTTQETLANARSARAWVLASGAPESAIARHFVAVSTNADAVAAFGISPENMFVFWDWVGGRYSVWSAIGLSLVLGLGPAGFEEFLSGARSMDDHFLGTPLADNLPVLAALVGIWHRNVLGCASRAVVPYDERLALLPAYLQQLEMESNGKSVTIDGGPVARATSPVVWGGAGTNGQHAYFQLLHQGTDIIPVDFIGCALPDHALAGHHRLLMANLFAQAHALMTGRPAPDAASPHKAFPGNRPSTLYLVERLTPSRLGALLALHEHRVFTEGVIWSIASFDQWGVELGKEIARSLLREGPPGERGALGWYNRHARAEDRLAGLPAPAAAGASIKAN